MSQDNMRMVEIATSFREHLGDAVARFAYIRPDVQIEVSDQVLLIAAQGTDLSAAARDFQFVLYRQKIYAETLPLRRSLIQGIMSR